MPQDKTILAVFDFDGTLTEGHLWKGMGLYCRTNHWKRAAFYTYIATHIPYWLASLAKLYPPDKNRIRWGSDLCKLFKNMPVEDLREVFRWLSEHYFLPLIRADVREVVESHRRQGHRVILLSGMFSEFLEVIGPQIGADFVVGSALEKRNALYTGKLIPPLCFGENKANYLQGLIRKQTWDVDYNASYAYADSIFDNPVFRLVGHPVAVYPDPELYQQALRLKWMIIGGNGL